MKKTHLISDFRTKNISLAGARTHENETRPEEIYEDQSLSVTEMFSHLDPTLVILIFSLSWNTRSYFISNHCDLHRLAHSTRDVESILRLIMHKHMT